MWTSRTTYGIRICAYLASRLDGAFTPVRTMSQALDLPPTYVAKVVQKLVRAALIESSRGPRGGVRLAVNPGMLSIYDVVKACDDDALLTHCVMGLHSCSSTRPCRMHEDWAPLQSSILQFLERASFDRLVNDPSGSSTNAS